LSAFAVVVIAIIIGICKRKADAWALYTGSGSGAERGRIFQGLIDD
jgi:hypothetical protein